jgi:hypothetical protein
MGFNQARLSQFQSHLVSGGGYINSKAVGPFYSKVTQDFIMTFGHEEPFNLEPPDNFLDPNGDAFILLPSTLSLDEREDLYIQSFRQ